MKEKGKFFALSLAGILMISTPAYANEISLNEYSDIQTAQETNVYTTPTNKANNIEAFVARFYKYILNREPDSKGLSEWTSNLKSGKEQGAQVGVGFIQSPEFIQRNLSNEQYIKVLYKTFFDREADSAGLNSWLSVMNEGLTRMQVYRGFAESNEFTKLCDNYGIKRGNVILTAPMDKNEGVTKFIYRCYKLCLNRTPDEAGLNQWCDAILSGKNTAKVAAHGFVFSEEHKSQKSSNTEYIQMLYRLFLDREADKAGLDSWNNALSSQGKSRLQVFEGFADSKEFKDLCDKYGINSGTGIPIDSNSSNKPSDGRYVVKWLQNSGYIVYWYNDGSIEIYDKNGNYVSDGSGIYF